MISSDYKYKEGFVASSRVSDMLNYRIIPIEATSCLHSFEKKKTFDVGFKTIDDSSVEELRARLKAKYLNHISSVESLRESNLDYLFKNNHLDSEHIQHLINTLSSNLNKIMLNSLERSLRSFIANNETLSLNYGSLLNYLYILPSKKIQSAEIAIDENTGKLIVFYNADKSDYYSKKITIMANEKDFTVSVISRKDGLAKFSGVYASMFPEAYFKIESLMETLTL